MREWYTVGTHISVCEQHAKEDFAVLKALGVLNAGRVPK